MKSLTKTERMTDKDGSTRTMSQWGGTSSELKIYRRLAELDKSDILR